MICTRTYNKETGLSTDKYVPETWAEYFVVFISHHFVHEIGEGYVWKMGYWPLDYKYDRNAYVCWIFYLVPFAYIGYRVRDLIRFIRRNYAFYLREKEKKRIEKSRMI